MCLPAELYAALQHKVARKIHFTFGLLSMKQMNLGQDL